MENSDIGGDQNGSPSTLPNLNGARSVKARSCKGCLYYSSVQKSKSKTPTCVGLSSALSKAPTYVVGETELEASKEGRSLMDFKYACVGYSVYLDKNDTSADVQNKQAELPFCVGLESGGQHFKLRNLLEFNKVAKQLSNDEENVYFQVLLDKRPADHATAHAHKNEEDGHTFPQPRTYKPTHSTGDEYLNRFKRNAGLVASGVARNMNRVYNHIKESFDDVLYPYRRRPK